MLNKNKLQRHFKINDEKKWNPVTIKKMIITAICKCGEAHEVSEYKPNEPCPLCRMKYDAEFANRANENGFNVSKFLLRSKELKTELKAENPKKYEQMIARIKKTEQNMRPVKNANPGKRLKSQECIELILSALGNKGKWKKRKDLAIELTGNKEGLNRGTFMKGINFLLEKEHIEKKKGEMHKNEIYYKNKGTYLSGNFSACSPSPPSPAPVQKNKVRINPPEKSLPSAEIESNGIKNSPPVTDYNNEPAFHTETEGIEKNGEIIKRINSHAKKIEIQINDVKILIHF